MWQAQAKPQEQKARSSSPPRSAPAAPSHSRRSWPRWHDAAHAGQTSMMPSGQHTWTSPIGYVDYDYRMVLKKAGSLDYWALYD